MAGEVNAYIWGSIKLDQGVSWQILYTSFIVSSFVWTRHYGRWLSYRRQVKKNIEHSLLVPIEWATLYLPYVQYAQYLCQFTLEAKW
jgi:hypothetical protein